jgi:hypothetical protein
VGCEATHLFGLVLAAVGAGSMPTTVDVWTSLDAEPLLFLVRHLDSEGSRSCVWAKCFVGGLGYQGSEKSGCLALPTNYYFYEDVLFFGLGTPGLQKATWPTNHFGIPLNEYLSVTCLPPPSGGQSRRHWLLGAAAARCGSRCCWWHPSDGPLQ